VIIFKAHADERRKEAIVWSPSGSRKKGWTKRKPPLAREFGISRETLYQYLRQNAGRKAKGRVSKGQVNYSTERTTGRQNLVSDNLESTWMIRRRPWARVGARKTKWSGPERKGSGSASGERSLYIRWGCHRRWFVCPASSLSRIVD
jgi:hypothetical protein